MPFARLASATRLAAIGTLSSTLALSCWAQQAPVAPTPQNTPGSAPGPGPELLKARVAFPESYQSLYCRAMWMLQISPTRRALMASCTRASSISSLNDAIALALENNLDIAIARYNLNIADTDVLRAKAGAQILGVNLGVVQNTPGGGVGGIGSQIGSGTGGTSLGAGGAGAGAGGIVSSTAGGLFGPFITSFRSDS